MRSHYTRNYTGSDETTLNLRACTTSQAIGKACFSQLGQKDMTFMESCAVCSKVRRSSFCAFFCTAEQCEENRSLTDPEAIERAFQFGEYLKKGS